MNIKYLAYNIFKTDYKRLFSYINQLNKREVSRLSIVKDILSSLFRDQTYFLDYFHFRYFDKKVPRDFYTNVWDMYKFQSRYNSRDHYMILRDKIQFRKIYSDFFNYDYFILNDKKDISSLITWINNKDKIVAKEPLGAVGKGVKVLSITHNNNEILIDGNSAESVLNALMNDNFILFEDFIDQHSVIKVIHPQSINTIRVVTFVNDLKEVEIWGANIRIGFDKSVDNFDAGGLGANIDIETGIISNAAIVKDPFTDKVYEKHPITGAQIKGVQIPNWSDILEMVSKAATKVPEVRTVGWDIALSTTGPTLIEGNDNWNRVLFQLATGIGLNKKIKRYL
jgi:hypothetical protein